MLKILATAAILSFWIIGTTAQTAQQSISELEEGIDELYGTEKLIAFHQIVDHYMDVGEPKKASRYVDRAIELADNIMSPQNPLLDPEDRYLYPLTYLKAASVYERQGFFVESMEALEKAQAESERIGNATYAVEAQVEIAKLDSVMEYSSSRKRLFRNAFSDVKSAVNRGVDKIDVSAEWKAAERNEESGMLHKAIDNYNFLLQAYTDQGDWQTVTEIQLKLADLYQEVGKHEEALVELQEARTVYERAGDSTNLAEVHELLDSISRSTDQSIAQLPTMSSSIVPGFGTDDRILTPQSLDSVRQEALDIRSQAERAESSDDLKRSVDYYKEFIRIQDVLAQQELMRELDSVEQRNLIDNRDREILMLKQREEIVQMDLERASANRRYLILGLSLTGAVLILIYFLYSGKKRDHKKLGIAYDNLAVAQNELTSAQARIKQLLQQQISGAVADELIMTKDDSKVDRKFVCVMFLDIRGFTTFAEKLPPEDIISYQNSVFGFMIDIVNQHGGVINQILGDGFMATFGAPASRGNDTAQAYRASLQIMEQIQIKCENGEIPPTTIGIGLHAGHVVTGNVGTEERKQYSITGNTVIIAARLEQLNKEFKSTMVVSREVHDQLPQELRRSDAFKKVTVKGRSEPVEVLAIYSNSKDNAPPVVSS